MTPEIYGLLSQIPLVGIFIAFVLITRSEDTKARERREQADRDERITRDKEWRDFLHSQNVVTTATLEKLCESFDGHASMTKENFAVLRERLDTRPRRQS